MMSKKTKFHKTGFENRSKVNPLLIVILLNCVTVYLIWTVLFLSKWFPYGFMQRIRDCLYKFF